METGTLNAWSVTKIAPRSTHASPEKQWELRSVARHSGCPCLPCLPDGTTNPKREKHMRTGVIIYVSSGTEPMKHNTDLEDLETRADYPGAEETYLACSEAEISWGCWRMLTRGLRRVECVKARYDQQRRTVVTEGEPMRLCG